MAEQDAVKRARRIRIIGGPLDEVELQLEELLETHTAIQFHFQALNDDIFACVVLVANRVLRAQQLAQGANGGFLR